MCINAVASTTGNYGHGYGQQWRPFQIAYVEQDNMMTKQCATNSNNSTFDTTYFNHANKQLYKSSVTHTPDQLYMSDQWLTMADATLL